MFSKCGSMLSKGLPKCTNCMFYLPYGVSKSYDLAKCGRFLDKQNKPIYAEMARMDDLKCSMYGTQYREKIEKYYDTYKNYPIYDSNTMFKQIV